MANLLGLGLADCAGAPAGARSAPPRLPSPPPGRSAVPSAPPPGWTTARPATNPGPPRQLRRQAGRPLRLRPIRAWLSPTRLAYAPLALWW
eukprot:5360532-Pyramimonas_sp.AAC.1